MMDTGELSELLSALDGAGGGATHDRPGWDEWGLIIAAAVATRGDCRRRRPGAVIMNAAHRIIGTGYVGVAPGAIGCLAGGCPRAFSDVPPNSSYDTGPGKCVSVHAEQQAIADAGTERLTPGCVIYVTVEPCPSCWNLVNRYSLRCVYPELLAKRE